MKTSLLSKDERGCVGNVQGALGEVIVAMEGKGVNWGEISKMSLPGLRGELGVEMLCTKRCVGV